MFTVENISVKDTDKIFQVSGDIYYRNKRYAVSGVQWKLPRMQNVHEVMVFEYKPDGTINWSEKYCERYTTDILAVFYRFTQNCTQNREAT